MASRRRKRKPHSVPAVPPLRERKFVPIAAGLLGVGVLAVALLLNLPGRQPESATTVGESKPAATTSAKESGTPPTSRAQTGQATKPAAEPAADRNTSSADAKPGFEVLAGRWLRPDSDGQYVVEVKSVDASGKMDASYSNPRPIHVSQANASQDGTRSRSSLNCGTQTTPVALTT